MRNLTIKREKSFVGCLGKMKIYIEDPVSNELRINGTPCRKIGDLKNGEEKVFQVGEQSAKIFVIADRLSKNYCCEYYQLPEGQEDIVLSGKNKFNPATGNAFRFDNNENEENRAHRKRGLRIGLTVLIAALIVGWFVGFLAGGGIVSSLMIREKTFSSSGMTITLTNEFKAAVFEGFTTTYDSKNVAVFVLKEEFTLMEGMQNYTLEEYGNLVIPTNGISAQLEKVEGLTKFEYEFTDSDTYKYIGFVFKSDDAFWLVQFATLAENYDNYSAAIMEWAKTISFE